MASSKPVKGWFNTPGRPGDRTLDQQMKGLDEVFHQVHGKTVLDAGCAEGLISVHAAKHGAVAVHGVEIVPEHVAVGNRLRGNLPVTFEVGDLNHWRPKRQYDVVLALAILHKVRNPTALCGALADATRDLLVMRLPPEHAPTVIDPRSNNEPHHMGIVMFKRGFNLFKVDVGEFGEWVGYFVRKTDALA